MKEQDMDRVKKAAHELIEHFDTVQIFCTRHESGELDGTVNVNFGKGNWFTRYGQVQSWFIKENQFSRNEAKED